MDQKFVLVEVPEAWFRLFTLWLGRTRIVDVKPEFVVAVHRVFTCFEESYSEYYDDQLDLFEGESR